MIAARHLAMLGLFVCGFEAMCVSPTSFCAMWILPCHGAKTTAREAVISNQSRKTKTAGRCPAVYKYIHLLKSCGCC